MKFVTCLFPEINIFVYYFNANWQSSHENWQLLYFSEQYPHQNYIY